MPKLNIDAVAVEVRDSDLRTGGAGARFGPDRRDAWAPGDRPFAVEKAGGQLLVVSRRPHRDDERLSVDTDLERLFDDDEVLLESFAPAADRHGAHTGRKSLAW